VKYTAVVLAKHPEGAVRESDFRVEQRVLPELPDNHFITENIFLSMDSGFRQWMTAGAGDNYLTGMQIGDPVQSIVLGRVIESRNPMYPVGMIVNARTAWETHSVLDGSDLCTPLEPDSSVPLHEYMATLGPTGVTAWLGMAKIGEPKAGEVLVVSAAGGAVGSVAGQLGKVAGCKTIGLTSSAEKARWLVDEVGYDVGISREESPDLLAALREHAPEGVDIFFDNVGGRTLDVVLSHLKENARIICCGAIAQYESEKPEPVFNTWELITKRALMKGFMFSDYVDEFPHAIGELATLLAAGTLKGPAKIYEGIDQAPTAFCDMMHGVSRGKCLVKL